MIGRTVSHYKIVEKIGEGGMGEVYLAEDLELRRRVALKFLPAEYASDSGALLRFKREAQAAATLDHSNIITIYDVGDWDGRPYIVMAYAEGDTLSHAIADRRLSLDRVLDIAACLCDALSTAHAASVVHRDIKPDNIVFGRDGQPKILDFGLAKLRGVTRLTAEASTVGTVRYMSPEQARGEDVDYRSDIFSLGAVIYEMIAGRPPFDGDHAAAVLYSIANEEPLPLARYNNAVTDELARVVAKAMAKDKKSRYQSAADMLVDLTALRDPEYGRSRPVASVGRRRSRLPFIAAVSLVIMIGVWFLVHNLQKAPSVADRKSVAVLPFQNMSADPENEYFSEGITDDIIAQLSKIADLRVVSRTSVMRYKDTDKSLREIAEELGVATILEGSVRREGDEVRIVSQLIDARTDEHVWANTYDRELHEIFQIQSDVAERIASALEAVLTPAEERRIQAPPTNDMTAYDYYLRGRQCYYRYRKSDNENAIVFFKKALERDKGYALAYAGLGDAYGQRVLRYGFGVAWVDSSLKASEEAIRLAPEGSEGYKAVAVGYLLRGWHRKALEANMKAAQLDPNYVSALGNVGWTLLKMGRPDEAFPWLQKVLEKDPEHYLSTLGIGIAYIEIGEYERGRQWLAATLDVQPDEYHAKAAIAFSYAMEERWDEATARARAISEAYPSEPEPYGILAWVKIRLGDAAGAIDVLETAEKHIAENADMHARSSIDIALGCLLVLHGDRERAQPLLARAEEYAQNQIAQGNEDYHLREWMAEVRSVDGKLDEALDWLERALEYGELDYKGVSADPAYAPLRDDERFKSLMAKMQNRVEEARRQIAQLDVHT